MVGEKKWAAAAKGHPSSIPPVVVVYLKHLGAVAQEPNDNEY